MKLVYMRLKGYIGISNGILRDEIVLDFSKSRHRICLIKGPTGSGKTTIMNAISPLPDDNASFVPGVQAEKEMVYNNGVRLLITHPVTNSGDRATTKAYIWRDGANLNPNGNVTSYKELIFDIFNLDSNYEALSKLSMQDRGLADKTPAVRKKYIANIMSDVEVYNSMYKTLNKNSSNLKALIRSMAAKLDTIGDVNLIDTNINALTGLIKQYEEDKDKALFDKAAAVATIKNIDPDGSIMKMSELNESNFDRYSQAVELLAPKIPEDIPNMVECNNRILKENELVSALTAKIEAISNRITELLSRSQAEQEELQDKVHKLESLSNDSSYDELLANLSRMNSEIEKIEEFFKEIHIEAATVLTTSEYRIGLKAIDEFRDALSELFDRFDRDTIISTAAQKLTIMPLAEMETKLTEFESGYEEYSDRYYSTVRLNEFLDGILAKKPQECHFKNCQLLQEAMQGDKVPEREVTALYNKMEYYDQARKEMQETVARAKDNNSCAQAIRVMINRLVSYNDIFCKFPEDVRHYLDSDYILSSLPEVTSYMRLIPDKSAIIELINKASMFDSYKILLASRDRLMAQKQIFESKTDVIDEIQQGINKIQKQLHGIEDDIIRSKSERLELKTNLEAHSENINNLYAIRENLASLDEAKRGLAECEAFRQKYAHDANELVAANRALMRADDALNKIAQALDPAKEELNKLQFNKKKYEEYQSEMAIYRENYDKTETVKMYTSPTGEGIQLVFMSMYMHSILSMANELLAKLFNGQFMLQPFIINGDEFRIPCIGNRMMNDDISSMSTGQICMISMILSFSILINSSTEYNILRLDEIDGGLDTDNRAKFLITLNDIMNILGCEQCFLISHNEEIQYSATDMIVLGHSSQNADYGMANVIFDASGI